MASKTPSGTTGLAAKIINIDGKYQPRRYGNHVKNAGNLSSVTAESDGNAQTGGAVDNMAARTPKKVSFAAMVSGAEKPTEEQMNGSLVDDLQVNKSDLLKEESVQSGMAVHEGVVPKPAATFVAVVLGDTPPKVTDLQPSMVVDEVIQTKVDSSTIEGADVKKVETVAGVKKQVNFRKLVAVSTIEGADVVLPKASIRLVQDRMANTLFGYFLGDRVAYPVVDYFARQKWVKHGLQKVMMNDHGFFFFKFADENGMSAVLEGGPWLIRNRPILLNCWSPTSQMKKEDISDIVVWVKLHNVPLAAYTDDGLSMIASKLGNPKRLDSYTSAMCLDSWGRSSYARALIEISATQDLKKVVSVAVPEVEGDDIVTVQVDIEYEWNPPRCSHCCVFGHLLASCPKQVAPAPKAAPKELTKKNDEGFTDVRGKNGAKKAGIPLKNQKPRVEYRPKKADTGKPKTSDTGDSTSTSKPKTSQVSTSNTFGALSGNGRGTSYGNEEYDDDSDFYGYDGYDGYDIGDFMMQGIEPKKKKGKDAGKPAGAPLIKRGFFG